MPLKILTVSQDLVHSFIYSINTWVLVCQILCYVPGSQKWEKLRISQLMILIIQHGKCNYRDSLGVEWALWLNKLSLIQVLSPSTTIWHSSSDKSVFVGAVGSSTICQGTQEESRLPMHWIPGMQIWVLTMNPAVVHEPAPAPLGHNPGDPVKLCLTQSQTKEPLWKSRFQHRASRTMLKQTKYEFGHTGEGKMNSLTVPTSLTFQHGTSLGPREIFWSCDFCNEGKWECVESSRFPQLCRTLQEELSSLIPSRIQHHELEDCRVGRAGGAPGRIFRALKGCGSY